MAKSIVFQWINNCQSTRLREAQQRLLESVKAFGLDPLIYPAGPEMTKFVDILRFAREHAFGEGFIWCNSDVLLTRNPYEITDYSKVHGFYRREIPSGEMTYGVDMYLIPNSIWDEYLSKDTPDLWCGAATIDWWITRACQKRGIFEGHTGFIDHPSHERSKASAGGDEYYQHNIREYNAWARRNGVGTMDEYVHLPLLGPWNNSVRNLFQRWTHAKQTKKSQAAL